MRPEIRPTPQDASALAAEVIIDELAVPGPTTLGLAGGTTPLSVYELLGRAGVRWSEVSLWLGDERWVPRDHPRSNAGNAAAMLGPEAAGSIVAPDYAIGDPRPAAASYDRRLETLFAPYGGRPHTILLGVGTDGHTASLFPGGVALTEQSRRYVAHRDAGDEWRLTATIPLLTAARHLVFLVTGIHKAEVMAEILDEWLPLPARIVAEGAARVTWILDAGAASLLSLREPR